jgi:hypothetical protein
MTRQRQRPGAGMRLQFDQIPFATEVTLTRGAAK